MDPRAVASGEVVFHELAYLEVETAVRKRHLTVRLADFILPNPDLVPASVRDKISGWADYVDYWAVDFTYGTGGHGDTFHNQWQSYRTRPTAGWNAARHTTTTSRAPTPCWSRWSTSSGTTPPPQWRWE
jgi:hypothetical protein